LKWQGKTSNLINTTQVVMNRAPARPDDGQLPANTRLLGGGARATPASVGSGTLNT